MSFSARLRTLVALGAAVSTASSFVSFGSRSAFSRVPFVPPVTPRDTTALPVLIYGWDGIEEECEATDIFATDDSSSGLLATCSAVGVALAESIQGNNQDKVGTLARLAVAFSPPERKIDLESIDTVQIMCISENQIEIEAILCENLGCVSLFVPIQFPHDCGPTAESDVLEKCVMDNLHYLDVEAESLIAGMVKSKADTAAASGGQDEALKELEAQLYSMTVYPSWWIPPETSPGLVAECDTIRRLLGDDEFQGDANALARKGLEALGLGGDYVVRKAVVTAVGPAGLCLRALAVFGGSTVLMDVPLPFGGGEPKMQPEALRAAVLGEAAAAHVL